MPVQLCRHYTHFCLHLVEEKKCSSGVNFDNSKEYLIYFGSRTNILLVGSISILTNHSSDTATLYLLGDHHHVHHLTFVSLLKPYLVPALSVELNPEALMLNLYLNKCSQDPGHIGQKHREKQSSVDFVSQVGQFPGKWEIIYHFNLSLLYLNMKNIKRDPRRAESDIE